MGTSVAVSCEGSDKLRVRTPALQSGREALPIIKYYHIYISLFIDVWFVLCHKFHNFMTYFDSVLSIHSFIIIMVSYRRV